MSNKHVDNFNRIIKTIAPSLHRYDVFRDFATISAISLHNAIAKCDDLEQEYFTIIKKYTKQDLSLFSELLGELVMGLEARPCDFLGSIYMNLDLGSKNAGQFFTPFEVSRLMAMMLFEGVEDTLSKKPFITLHEPSCGSGGMVIGYAQALIEKGFNPQQQLWVSCIDIDSFPAMMTYVQLSLLHIPAEVITGDTLRMDFRRVMKTPAHYLGGWDEKLKTHKLQEDIKSLISEPAEIKEDKAPESSKPEQLAKSITNEVQLSLFK